MYINLVKDYEVKPFGRYCIESSHCGHTSGEEVRDFILKQHLDELKDGEVLTIDLTGSNRFHLSWLEECFGGLVRHYGVNPQVVNIIHNECPRIVEDAYKMMENAWRVKHGF